MTDAFTTAPIALAPSVATSLETARLNARPVTALGEARAPTSADIDRAAREFEALFAAQILKPMFEGLSTDGPFSGGHAEKMWRGVMLEKLGDRIAEAGGLGLADAVRAALTDAAGPQMEEPSS